MIKFLLAALISITAISSVSADETTEGNFDFANDRFLVGSTIVQEKQGVEDLFMAGETVTSEQDIAGSLHMAGRKVVSKGGVAGNAYLAGMDVSLDGKVDGDVTVTGYNIQVGEVAGDVRATGSNITLSGPVAGYALIAGDDVTLDSIIDGDVALAARELEFAEGSRIGGKLTLYEEKIGVTEIPAGVVSEDRIERREMSQWSESTMELTSWNWRQALLKFIVGVIIVAGVASLIAAILPQKLADLRRGILDRPIRTLWFGVLAESVAIGLTILLMMTFIGLLLAPATIFITLVLAFAGYVVAAYAFGVGLLKAIGRDDPNSMGTRALAAGVGALSVGLIGLIPFFGWLFVMALALTGVGSISIWLLKPRFFSST